ncbi:MAG: methyltransferase domain-containing protein [Planctomycetes bacterium]|nr:methyltransferase domain-containing protein [Planctomycetota bacterium]MBI3833350.1 methyltransferase domain-containing protein [Planctomycetota bacterium]
MSAPDEKSYVLGTHDDELARLGFQHRVWAEYAFALWERAGFAPNQTILDLGCGPGYATLDLARIAGPSGKVIAVDGSPRFIQHLQAQLNAQGLCNVETKVLDVHDLNLESGSVDRVYIRWVLCFVRDPRAVIKAVAKSLRKGGVLAVQDYFAYESSTLAPRSEAFTKAVRATGESWRSHGGDPDLVARLPAILSDCGMELREIRPILRVARPGTALWEWPTSFWRNYVPTLVSMGLLTRADADAFGTDWQERSNDPNTFWCTPPVFDVVAVKK